MALRADGMLGDTAFQRVEEELDWAEADWARLLEMGQQTPVRSRRAQAHLSGAPPHSGGGAIGPASALDAAFPDTSAVTVRPAVPADIAAIGRLGALLVRLHHEFDPRRFVPAPPRIEDAYASFIGAQLQEPNTLVLCAPPVFTIEGILCPRTVRDRPFTAAPQPSSRHLPSRP